MRTAKAGGTGHIRCGGTGQDLTLTPTHDGALNDRNDGAYRTKYAAALAYVPPVVADRCHAATLKLTPRGPKPASPSQGIPRDHIGPHPRTRGPGGRGAGRGWDGHCVRRGGGAG
ncbi:DUF2255 family protein [Streptomyces aquilus]|uniref:DUF2255 family protein n=1 Tax=Streptomyces aquilus TaxID=2548456 RepID=A0A3S5HMG2_9ACTN|nr:DUF2255 family protein [Streptomyces aquilus]